MRISLLIGGAFQSAVATAVFAESVSDDVMRKRYLPECTASGDLIPPKNFQ
ncbi:hypothetical protein V1291_003891 [Nitrobacteraceae bacterium AZCC 1564]